MARKHKEDEVLKSLRKKHDVRVNDRTREIEILSENSKIAVHDIGNSSWGKIDYLCNYKGYRYVRVSEFSK